MLGNCIPRGIIMVVMSLFSPVLLAAEPIVFKQELSPKNGWIHYGLTMGILLVFILVLAKKYNARSPDLINCQLIEKKHLGNKTVVYVIEYQQQRFLLADNQQALTMHPLEQKIHEAIDEPV